jgi:ParB family chromosome partitioning protein
MNTQTITADTLAIPFNKLVADADNVRKTRTHDDIGALADNIEAEGLLQNLLVRKVKGGKFAVIGGERRRRALALLVERKAMKAAETVPCRLIETEATSASLSENIHRLAMHPADQFDAWRKMADSGLSVDDISKRHGASKKLIEQRLKLGRLSPVILDALRADEINVDAAAAFTISDDHTRQETVFAAIKQQYHSMNANVIKRLLTDGEIPDSDPRAAFVGREAYEAAGGEIRTDLFAKTVYFIDSDLLTRLVTEKLESEAARLMAEGWLWIETNVEQNWQAGQGMSRVYPKKEPLTLEEQAEGDRIEARLEEIEAAGNEEEHEAEFQTLANRLEALEQKEIYSPEDQAKAGGFISIGYRGALSCSLGFIRPEDNPNRKTETAETNSQDEEEASGFGKSLSDDLAAIRREILQAELMKNPKVASDLLAFHTVSNLLAEYHWQSPFQMTAREAYGARTVSEKGDMGRFTGRADFEKSVAGLSMDWHKVACPIERFEAFRALTEEEKTGLLAYAAAQMLLPQLADDSGKEPTLERAAEIMGTKPADYWRPGAEFFQRMTKGHMLEVAKEVIGPDYAKRHGKSQKSELAASMGNVFLPADNTADAYPKARARINAWLPFCMAGKTDSESEGGLSSPTDA